MTDSRPCAFRPPSMAAELLSFACPKRSNQEKTAPSVSRRSRSERFAAGGRGFAHRPSWPVAESARSLALARVRCTRLVRPPFAALRGDPESRARRRIGEGTRVRLCLFALLLRQGLPRSALPGFPLGRGEDAEEKAAKAWRAQDARPVRLSAHGRAVGEPRSVLAQSPGMDARRPRPRGCLSLGYFSLDKQREVTRPPWMADDTTHGRESVVAKR